MSQRRDSNSSGRGDERSDLTDMKAMAAKARSGRGAPAAAPNPSELSGVRVRRDSVIGARLTPPPRATGGELPNWFWGALGCLSVLLVGFAALFVLASAGKLGTLLPAAALAGASTAETAQPSRRTSPSPSPSPVAAEPAPSPAPAEPAPAAPVAAAVPAAAAAPARQAPAAAEPRAVPAAPDPAAAQIVPIPTSAPAPPPESPHAPSHERAAPAAKIRPNKPPAAPAVDPAQNHNEGADTIEAKPPGSARPGHAAVAKPAAAAAESDEDDSPPGQDAVEAALDALASRVRGCFVKYQIKGTARVRLVATPSGAAESVNVTGDFEDTPTGMCVEAVISGAKLPSFKGPPLRLSQSYQLR